MARINGAVTDEVGTVLAELPDVTIVNTEHGYRWAGKAKIVVTKTFPPSLETLMTTPYFLSLKDGRFARIKIIRFTNSMFSGTVLEFDGASRLEAPKPGTVAPLKTNSTTATKPATATANAPDPHSQIGQIIIPSKSNDKPASIPATPIPSTNSSTGKPPATQPLKHVSLNGFQPPPSTGSGPARLTSSGVRPLSMTGSPASGAPATPGAKPPTAAGVTTQSSTGSPNPVQATTKPPTAPGIPTSSNSSASFPVPPRVAVKLPSAPGFKTVSSSGIQIQPGTPPPASKPRSVIGFTPTLQPSRPPSVTGTTQPGPPVPEAPSFNENSTVQPLPVAQSPSSPRPGPGSSFIRPVSISQSGVGLVPPPARPQSISGVRPALVPGASQIPPASRPPSISGMNPNLHTSHTAQTSSEESTSSSDTPIPPRPSTAPGVVHASALSFRPPPKTHGNVAPNPPTDTKK